jgi:hypothetical protein
MQAPAPPRNRRGHGRRLHCRDCHWNDREPMLPTAAATLHPLMKQPDVASKTVKMIKKRKRLWRASFYTKIGWGVALPISLANSRPGMLVCGVAHIYYGSRSSRL